MQLDELDYDHNLHQQEFAGDDKLFVRFYTDILPDEEKTKETGIRKFREAEMIQIITPGDRRNIIVREVRELERVRFAEKYAKFKAGQTVQDVGFPLSEVTWLSKAIIEELKYLGFSTVEHVAQANDAACSKYPGLREISRRAKQWLEAQKSDAPLQKLNSALEEAQKKIAALEASIEAQAKELQKAKAVA